MWYNGQPDSREEVLRAAAIMADVEKMELLGALYFRMPGVVLEKLGTAKVDGRECDQVLAIVRPGFGYAAEDHVILSIDHEAQRLHHASTTLHGFKRAGDARLEVTFRNWAQRNGVWWATDCDERIPGVMKIDARQVRLLDLKANHGFAPRHPELVGEAASEASQSH